MLLHSCLLCWYAGTAVDEHSSPICDTALAALHHDSMVLMFLQGLCVVVLMSVTYDMRLQAIRSVLGASEQIGLFCSLLVVLLKLCVMVITVTEVCK